MNIRYAHIRYTNLSGQPVTKGGCTLGYVFNPDGTITVAKALCNNSDNYNKSIGRAIVAGRIKAGKCNRIKGPEANTNIVDFLLDHECKDIF